MLKSDKWNKIFDQSIHDYHVLDDVDQEMKNPYSFETEKLKNLLYEKNWIDTVQWHFEDLIREPNIDPVGALKLKRRIDKSNQWRTDTVERVDDWFIEKFSNITANENATMNSESPAWVLDRMSILCLKIFHMKEETTRKEADPEHKEKCAEKLKVLLVQQTDLTRCLDELLEDVAQGIRYTKVYRQMKMYNDPKMNPVLYKSESKP
ncbi:MAG: DUF4254 domain-containing protein [Leptospirales bacterium]